MSRHDQLLWHVNLIYNKIVYMNIMAEAQWASAYLSPQVLSSSYLTVVMKHDCIRGTDFLGCLQADPVQGSINDCCSHG